VAGVIAIDVPSQARLPEGPFGIVVRHTAGRSVTVTAGPGGVCRLEPNKIRPVAVGTCVVRATADGTSESRSVQIVKGTPTIGWALKAETQHSNASKRHGIWSNSDGNRRYSSLTPAQCSVAGALIKAVAVLQTSSLGLCRVQVDVKATANWLAARRILETEIVEAVISIAIEVHPAPIKDGGQVEVVVRKTHPDSSIDDLFFVYIEGCGSSNADRASAGRTVTFTYTASILADGVSTGKCTLTAHAGVPGTLLLVGSADVSKPVDVVR
jgi:hypothetical protein